MMDLAKRAVEAAEALGVEYVDARVNRVRNEQLEVRDGRLELGRDVEDLGVGVRVLKDGAWGFAALPLDAGEGVRTVQECARRAVASASALAPARTEGVRQVPQAGEHSEYRTPVEVHPLEVPLEDKIALLMEAERSLEGADETVVREASCDSREEEQWQASNEGAEIHQTLIRCGAGISTTAAAHGEVQRRSFPASFGGNYVSAGWEHVLGLDLASHGERMRDESVALCSAPAVEPGEHDAILMGNQLMLQIHESVGHPNELDRVHGHEVDLAGASFATQDLLGTFQYGSEHVNLVADSTVPGGLDTRSHDDDGVPSQRFHVVENGVFRGYHTSREWADRLGEDHSRSTSRAEGWYNPPIIRITNLSLMPGAWALGDLLADTEDGLVCDTVKMWSIDQRRLNFQFTTEIAWEIKDGERGRILRNPTYQGSTPTFWRSCDAICGPDHWELFGVPNCGKGNPIQTAEMSHGCAPARFRGLTFL